jgi:intracellular septation protein A
MTIKSLQNDTFYIIKLGGDILNYGIDLIDHYSWVANLSYTYPHWLYDLLMYLIYSNFDFLGIYVSTMLLFIILILSIYIVNLRVNKNELMAAIIAVVTLILGIQYMTANAEDKAKLKIKLVTLVIATIVLSGAQVIWATLYNFLESTL